MTFNCPCDEIKFPPPLAIAAGLASLPRQIATFPEFRAAMLSVIGTYPPLADWRARSSNDFGVMLLEMWAYVCDDVSFYDEVIADESYLRTAQLRSSLRKLVGLLGYVPRPAVAATGNLAILAEGRQPVLLPRGTQFRSGAFPGSPPQVFELDVDSTVHPFLNKWNVAPIRPTTIDGGGNLASVNLTSLLLEPGTVHLTVDQIFLFEVSSPHVLQARRVKSLSDYVADDGATYTKLDWDRRISIPGNTRLTEIRLTAPTQTASLWPQSTPVPIDIGAGVLRLDRTYRQLKSGSNVVLERDREFHWFKADAVSDRQAALPAAGDTTITTGTVTTTVTPPAINVPITRVDLNAAINDANHQAPSAKGFNADRFTDYVLYYGSDSAGTVVAPARTTLGPGDPLDLLPPVEMPLDSKTSNRFQLEDKNEIGDEVTGGLDFSTRSLTLDQTSRLAQLLTVPVSAYGNIVKASRGETIASEILGSGDASLPNQSFTLKKKPVSYTPSATAGNESGVASSLKIYVDGIRWAEVPSFFGVTSDARAYIVRQNDDGESIVTFGDGVQGSRLATGSNNVVASYRFGGGKATPPAGSIHQLGKPVKGIKSVRNLVMASGGDDAEAASGLRTYAPRSALLLGRAISIQDMEAAAASVGGVRAVRAEWRWNQVQQRPLIQIWYIGAAGVAATVLQKLRALSDPTVPIAVDRAVPMVSSMSISIAIDSVYLEANVLPAVRAALMNTDTGQLAPENIGIGLPIFRSHIFETVLAVEGTVAVNGLMLNAAAFNRYGVSPDAGKYFDFENGTLFLNGKAGS